MKNKKSSNFFSLLGASGNGRGDIRVCTDGSVLALGNPAFAQTNSTEKKRIITRQPRNSDTLCYHDYSHLAMKVSEHKYSYIYIYICVYIGVVLERVTERWREREKCYLYWFASLHSTLSWLYGLSTLSGLVFKFFSVACEA